MEIQVFGSVHGVGFRYRTKWKAEKLKLAGWVRNEPDGSVQIVAEGPEEKLQELIEWCRKGTEWARIEKVEMKWKEAKGEFGGFEIK